MESVKQSLISLYTASEDNEMCFRHGLSNL